MPEYFADEKILVTSHQDNKRLHRQRATTICL